MPESSTVKKEWMIANIPFEAGDQKEAFEEYFRGLLIGRPIQVEEIRFIRTKPPERRFKGYGFATVASTSEENIEEALEFVRGAEYRTRELDIKFSHGRPPLPSGERTSSSGWTRTTI